MGMQSLQGYEATIALFKKYQKTADEVTDGIMRDIAEQILERAKSYTPIDTGSLIESGQVFKNGPANYQISFGFGGGGERDPYYAAYVHEVTAHDANRTPPRGSKYLSRAVNDFYPTMTEEFGAQFAGEMTYSTDSEGRQMYQTHGRFVYHPGLP